MSRVCPHQLQWLVYVLVFSLTLNLINNLELSRPFFFHYSSYEVLAFFYIFYNSKVCWKPQTEGQTKRQTDQNQYSIYGLDLWCIWHKINIHHCGCVHRNLLTKPLEIIIKNNNNKLCCLDNLFPLIRQLRKTDLQMQGISLLMLHMYLSYLWYLENKWSMKQVFTEFIGRQQTYCITNILWFPESNDLCFTIFNNKQSHK